MLLKVLLTFLPSVGHDSDHDNGDEREMIAYSTKPWPFLWEQITW